MSFSRYSEYKDSGVEGLGAIPAHWHIATLKRLLIEPLKYGANEASDDDTEGHPRFVRITDITADGALRDDTFRSLPPDVAREFLLEAGDVLLARSGATVGKSFIYRESWGVSCFAGYLIRVRANRAVVDSDFVYLCCQSSFYWEHVKSEQIQATIQNVSAEKYGKFVLPLPPLDEQRAVATFLDRETAKIDALVAEQQRLIELLKEKRQAVISQAVTKGLDPNVPMKDSGVEWLGQVPAHWEVMTLKRQTEFVTSGARGWAENYSEDGELFLRIGNLTRNTIRLDLTDVQRVAVAASAESERTRALPGDLLFSITAYLGSVAVIPKGLEPAYVSQHVALVRLRGNRLDPEWAAYVAASHVGRTFLETQGYGGTKIQLSLGDVADLLMLVPRPEEQRAIIDHIERETSKLQELIEEAASAMQLLQERRAALISAAVTGKIDVRGLVPQREPVLA
jgi:type I restriction enzyme S subunit